MASTRTTVDVIVIGFGPVGATAALLLRQHGLTVAVIEREQGIFPLPRAALIDGEIARVFQNLDILGRLGEFLEPMPGAGFRTGKGEPIGPDLVFPKGIPGPQGHPESQSFHQPVLERVLRERAAELGVDTWLGWEAEAPEQDGRGVRMLIRPTGGGDAMVLEGSWLIAADGAASPVREHLGIDWGSVGYDRDWLVMDIVLEDDTLRLPEVGVQVCDPERIHTFVPMCGPRRRLEFIFNPGETREHMLRESTLWELLSRYVDPGQARIERAAAYQFHAAISARWREGRIFLAGDAAHQMPPFLAQGMCTGIRDAMNLSWKLALVQQGRMPASSLDSYQSERKPHALDTVDHAVAIGKLMDAFAAAQIDGNWPTDLSAVYGGTRSRDRLQEGILSATPGGLRGALGPQPMLQTPSGPVLMDEVGGTGFRLLIRDGGILEAASPEQALIERTGITVVQLPPHIAAASPLPDPLGGHQAILLRPDHYVFGVADSPRDIGALLTELVGWFVD